MAANLYMIARPSINSPALANQSQNPLFKGWSTTELMSFALGTTNPATISSSSSAGRISLSPLTISKPIDSNSPIFLRYCAAGLHFDRITLYVTRPGVNGAETVVDIYALGLV